MARDRPGPGRVPGGVQRRDRVGDEAAVTGPGSDIHTAVLTAMRQFSHGVTNRAFSFLRSDIQFSVGPTVRSYTTNVHLQVREESIGSNGSNGQ